MFNRDLGFLPTAEALEAVPRGELASAVQQNAEAQVFWPRRQDECDYAGSTSTT